MAIFRGLRANLFYATLISQIFDRSIVVQMMGK